LYTGISVLTFLFIVSCGLSALILGCIQNFDCRTIKFPQDNVRNGTSPGSFDSGPFTYRFSGVLNTFVTTNNNSALAVVDEENTPAQNLWQVCRSYKEFNQDLNLSQLLTANNDNNTSYSNNSIRYEEDDVSIMTVQGMAISACILGSLLILGVCTVPHCGLACGILQWKCYAILFMITGILQGLSLLILNSTICLDNPFLKLLDELTRDTKLGLRHNELLRDTFVDRCEIDIGFKCGIASTILWFVMGILICCKRLPGKYKEDCLTQYLQMSSEAAAERRMEKERVAKESLHLSSSSNSNNSNSNSNSNSRGVNRKMGSRTTTTTKDDTKINNNNNNPSTKAHSPSVLVAVEQEHNKDDCGDDDENPIFHSATDFVVDGSM
jgi:hypothetical protein